MNSFLCEDMTHVIVQLKQPFGAYATHAQYRTDYYTEDGRLLVVFCLPQEFRATAVKFKEGKYSQFSNEAKDLIKKKSGLNYKVPNSAGKVSSSRILLALDKDKDLKAQWERDLAVKLSADAELMDIPGDNEFVSLELERVQQG